MRNTPLRKTVALAVSMGLLIAAVSGGAVTYASFTDSGSVDVTFTAGNISDSSDEVSVTEANTTGSNTTEANTTEANTTEANTTEANTTEANTTDSNTTETNTSDTETNTSDTETNTSDTATADTNSTDSNTSETNTNDSEQLSDGFRDIDIPTTDGLGVDRMTDPIPALATTAVEHRRLPVEPPPRGG